MNHQAESRLSRAERQIRELGNRITKGPDSDLIDLALEDLKEANAAYELLLRATQFQHEYYTEVAKKRKLGLAETALFDAAKAAMAKANLL